MIRTKDLRLGNIVNDNMGFAMKVVSIFQDEVYLNFDEHEGDYFEEDFMKLNPVQITEELLAKIGAVKIEDRDFKSYKIAGMEINLIDGKWIEYVHRIEVVGLHALQNIFYFTRGEELGIKLSDL